jgi:3-(3-hydroxy-phenyl)propionate hydroxylase
MKQFRHGRVIFAGDSAHQVSPFGARGANSGMQDVDNLGWKLGMVIRGEAPEALLNSYDEERCFGADENILNSTRSTDFITPKSKISHVFRNAVLGLAEHYDFARPLVNSGRLSVPCVYDGLSCIGEDDLALGPARTRPGAPCPDAPFGDGYLLNHLGGGFTLMALGVDLPDRVDLEAEVLRIAPDRITRPMAERYLGDAGRALYLIRPDQHVVARWANYDAAAVTKAMNLACGNGG